MWDELLIESRNPLKLVYGGVGLDTVSKVTYDDDITADVSFVWIDPVEGRRVVVTDTSLPHRVIQSNAKNRTTLRERIWFCNHVTDFLDKNSCSRAVFCCVSCVSVEAIQYLY